MSDNSEMSPIQVPEDAVYGITIFQTESDSPVVTVSGKPDLGQLHRMVLAAEQNLHASIIAEKVADVLNKRASAGKIIMPKR